MRAFEKYMILAVLSLFACGGGFKTEPPGRYNGSLQAGALIEIYTKPDKIETTCTQQESLGKVEVVEVVQGAPTPAPSSPDVSLILRSKEPDFTSSAQTDASLSLDATVARLVKQLQAKGKYKYVKNITYSATNVTRYTVSISTVYGAAKKHRDQDCKDTVIARAKEGKAISIATQVFVGDVTYELAFNTDVSVDVKAEIVKDVSPTVAASFEVKDASKIVGKQIVWLAANSPYGPSRTGD